ncbi:hypothetical protein TSAR_009480 [Trichomalopsis sarcophagae]|uniref:Uncharacterized protein n=1 Tax=Trichomalopsis sarcophagae TaxID=543379 RepID=A0A232FHH0_9HYME|nr:hypothetical protein TSAR_009480 [Trichomalopsis sarcophagae]
MPLSSSPKTDGLPEMEKGIIPYLFNNVENQAYERPLPTLDTYTPDTMSSKEQEQFLKWYDKQVQDGYI